MRRTKELDGLRAIAALMVIAGHYIGIPDGPDFWLWNIFHLGHFGVRSVLCLVGILGHNDPAREPRHHWVAYLVFAARGIERTVRTFSGVAATLASAAVTFGICALSYRYLEKPLIEFAHRRFRF